MIYHSGFDSVLGMIVVLLIMAASSWMQKKAEAQQRSGSRGRSPQPPPGPPTQRGIPTAQSQPPPPPAPRMDWQAELRRLLEVDNTPAAPAPVLAEEPVAPAAPPLIIVPRLTTPTRVPGVSEPEEGPLTSRLKQSAAAYQRAQHLHEETAGRLQQMVEQNKQHKPGETTSHRSTRSPELTSAVSLVRNRASVRQAFVASIVLSPPKGLEN